MQSTIISWIRAAGLGLACAAAVCGAAHQAEAQLTRGYERSVQAGVINEEIVRQPDLWVMEVQFKPMRMVWVDITDPKTGQAKREQIWYLPWRAIRRPIAGRPVEDVLPINELDPIPGPPQFIPSFTLSTYESPQSLVPSQILEDDVLPTAMDEIRRIERENVLNTVAAVQDVPAAVTADADEQPWIYGAATWRGVDPETDFFKVILSGFSNGYEKRTVDGKTQIWRKVIVQHFARPGDRYDPNQREFKFVGVPEWVMQPDAEAAPQAVSSAKP